MREGDGREGRRDGGRERGREGGREGGKEVGRMGERERSCMCYICMPAFVRAFVRSRV